MDFKNLKEASDVFIKNSNKMSVTHFVYRVIEGNEIKERKTPVQVEEVIDFFNPFGKISIEDNILQVISKNMVGMVCVEQAIPIIK